MMADNIRLAVALNGYGATHPDGSIDVLPWGDVLEHVATAEETGYEAIFSPEIGAREAFATLGAFATHTTRITLATGVVPTWSREVRRMAMGTATLNELSGGRFVLGLGSLDRIDATRRYVAMVRELLTGDPAADGFAGSNAPGAIDLVPEERVPIFLAALGPRMTELAGEIADGVILNWCTPERVARARDEVATGAERAGRDPRGILVTVFVRACLGHDDEHARIALTEAAARYAVMPKYARQFAAMNLGDTDPAKLAEAVCVTGDRPAARDRLAEYRDAGADLVAVYPVPAGEAASSIMGTILAAAPEPAVEA